MGGTSDGSIRTYTVMHGIEAAEGVGWEGSKLLVQTPTPAAMTIFIPVGLCSQALSCGRGWGLGAKPCVVVWTADGLR